jgi:hypothetical protein
MEGVARPGFTPHIVGQLFTIKGWFPTVLLICNCGHPQPVMIPQGAASQCTHCKAVYSVQGCSVVNGQLQIGVARAMPDNVADPPPAGTNGT